MANTSYIQGHDASTLKSHQTRSAEVQADYLLPHIKPESHILDVGCGPGTITCGFAKYASKGKVVGVDFSDKVLQQARSEAESRGIPEERISFQAASAFELPFPDESFDIVHCHALLVHLPKAVNAVKEMRRVCKTGGYVAAREPDCATCVVHPYSSLIQEWIASHNQLQLNEGSEPNGGRHLAEWAIAAGFAPKNVTVTCNVLEYFGEQQVKFWGELYADRMSREEGERAVRAGLATHERIGQWRDAYLEWSKTEGAIWAMMHMRLLAQK